MWVTLQDPAHTRSGSNRGNEHLSCFTPGTPSVSGLALWIHSHNQSSPIIFSISSSSPFPPLLHPSPCPCSCPSIWICSEAGPSSSHHQTAAFSRASCLLGSLPGSFLTERERGQAAMILAPWLHFISGSPPRGRAWQPLLLLGKQTAVLGNVGFSKLCSGSLQSWMLRDLQSAWRDNSEQHMQRHQKNAMSQWRCLTQESCALYRSAASSFVLNTHANSSLKSIWRRRCWDAAVSHIFPY